MTQQEYNEFKAELQRLQEKLDSTIIEKPQFEAKGKYIIGTNGLVYTSQVIGADAKSHCNCWETEEQAEQASVYQYNHNLIMNYVMQFDGELGLGDYYIYNYKDGWRFSFADSCYYPEVILMTKQCAEALIQDIKDGVVVFKEVK